MNDDATKTGPVLAFERQKATPPIGKSSEAQRIDRWRRAIFAGATPNRIKRVLDDAAKGDVEDWADLAEYMLRTDAHLRAVYETFLRGVASAELIIKPASRGDTAQAEAAADFVRESRTHIKRWDAVMMHLLHAIGMGFTLIEQQWQRRAGAWHVTGHTLVPPRDAGFQKDWGLEARTFIDGGVGKWISLGDEPARWLIHVPGSVGLTPNVSGVLQSVAWTWLFKLWTLKNANIAIERLGSPFMFGVVEDNSTGTARDTLAAALDEMSAGMSGIIEEGTDIRIIGEGASANAGKAHKEWILYLDNQITKGILGSTLNTDVHPHGGNRALGESQADVTVMPRFEALAASAASALEQGWVKPLLEMNAHLFGGVCPPIPTLGFQLHAHEPNVTDLVVANGAAIVDELRRTHGLPEWGPENGGSRILQPLAKARSKIEQQTASRGPSGEQLKLIE